MVKICQTCGEIGVAKALIFCSSCWDTAEHIYCLGLSAYDIDGLFNWTCDSCAVRRKRRVAMVMYGDQVDKTGVSKQLVRGVPVVGPIWRGEIEIIGSVSDKLDGLEVFMPTTSYSKVVKVKRSMQRPLLCFSMQSRDALWPKHFDEVGAIQKDIDVFMFPETSRSDSCETDYDNLVELMIANDLAMTSRVGSKWELIIFTSLEQEDNQQQIQGKYYLWGVFKGKGFQRRKPPKGKKKPVLYTQSPLAGEIGLNVGDQLITTTPSLATYDFIPPLSQKCKRARSKRRRMSTTENKEAVICQAVVADVPGKEMTDRPSNGCVSVKLQQTHDELGLDKICSMTEQIHQTEHIEVEKACGFTVEERKPDEKDSLCKEDTMTCAIRGDDMKDDLTNVAEGACSVDGRSTNQGETCHLQSIFLKALLFVLFRCFQSFSNHFLVLHFYHYRFLFFYRGDSPLLDFTVKLITEDETKEQHSWDSNMEIDESSDSLGIHTKKADMRETRSWDSDMEIDEPHDDVTKGLTVAAPHTPTDLENRSCLTPLRDKEELDVPEANHLTHGEMNSCTEEKALGNKIGSGTDECQKITANTLPGMSEISAGLCEGAAKLHQPERQTSDHLSQKDPCRTPVLDFVEPVPSSSSTDTVVLEIDDEEEEKETAMKEFENFNDEIDKVTTSPVLRISDDFHDCADTLLDFVEPVPSSYSTDTVVLEIDDEEEEEKETAMKEFENFNFEIDKVTTSSVLRISDDFHDCADTLRVQVGRYMIRSDLAPILTKILNKHGDIALGCAMMPELLLEDICLAFREIEPISFSGLRSYHLDHLRNLCKLGEALKIDLKWLSKRCDELEKAALQISLYLSLKEHMVQCNKALQSVEQKLKVKSDTVASLLDENQSLEKQLQTLKERVENMQCEVVSMRSQSRRFLGKSLADGLF